MTATEILRSEHELIDRALDRLEALCGTLGKAGASAVADSKSMSDTIEFIQAYADERHHRKEEQGLFPALERCGRSSEPTASGGSPSRPPSGA